MSKFTDLLRSNLEMTAIEVAKVEVKKVPDPTVRAGLEVIVDLLEHLLLAPAPATDSGGSKALTEEERTG